MRIVVFLLTLQTIYDVFVCLYNLFSAYYKF